MTVAINLGRRQACALSLMSPQVYYRCTGLEACKLWRVRIYICAYTRVSRLVPFYQSALRLRIRRGRTARRALCHISSRTYATVHTAGASQSFSPRYSAPGFREEKSAGRVAQRASLHADAPAAAYRRPAPTTWRCFRKRGLFQPPPPQSSHVAGVSNGKIEIGRTWVECTPSNPPRFRSCVYVYVWCYVNRTSANAEKWR